jgi:hypothetical protein
LRKPLVLALAALSLAGTPAAAQLPSAPLDQVFASYNDCFAATNTPSLVPDALEQLGWERATIQGRGGERVENAPIIFARGDRAPLIMLSGLEGQGICIVSSRIASFAVFDEFKAAFGGKLPKPEKNGEITYQAEGRIVRIAPAGTPEKPGLKLIVGTRMESK